MNPWQHTTTWVLPFLPQQMANCINTYLNFLFLVPTHGSVHVVCCHGLAPGKKTIITGNTWKKVWRNFPVLLYKSPEFLHFYQFWSLVEISHKVLEVHQDVTHTQAAGWPSRYNRIWPAQAWGLWVRIWWGNEGVTFSVMWFLSGIYRNYLQLVDYFGF